MVHFGQSHSSFFFIDPAPTAIYTLSLHDALPISIRCADSSSTCRRWRPRRRISDGRTARRPSRCVYGATTSRRSEEHTSELQSLTNLVCRLLLEKKKANPK